ncbi:hypothetical protein M2447_000174 [Ereboglobus sp. PH5-10]|uniref:hypothetical protein n=1 Tax=Ereboglobus sp. PH5-10 TaxID=2940629 RepID=UPI00240580B7|nr:hypothetical protein [Ereboglobus sp. PH5-10]MDF9826098.1 hypothetical protein [Ereboglobus sp. PH5-10]
MTQPPQISPRQTMPNCDFYATAADHAPLLEWLLAENTDKHRRGAAYCHEVRAENKGPVRGRLEYLDILASAPPVAKTLATTKLRFRDRLDGKRWQAWVARLDAESGVRRVAQNIPPPAAHKTRARPNPLRRSPRTPHPRKLEFQGIIK